MTLSPDVLTGLCPMHLRFDANGVIRSGGRTIARILAPQDIAGAALFDLLEPVRPRGLTSPDELFDVRARRLRFRLRSGMTRPLYGHAVRDGTGGGILDLSFGLGVAEALGTFSLSEADFSPTDLTIELLFVLESKSAAMDSVMRIARRLDFARIAAEENAKTDPLTDLLNRRGIELELDELYRAGRAFVVVHIDLDHFKKINDIHGHAAGDRVLRAVGQHMRAHIREDDVAGRIGGDEFIILLRDPPPGLDLAHFAQRLIRRIETPLVFRDARITVSASIGVAGWTRDRADERDPVDEADAALYRAKAAGRGSYEVCRGTALPDATAGEDGTAESPNFAGGGLDPPERPA